MDFIFGIMIGGFIGLVLLILIIGSNNNKS